MRLSQKTDYTDAATLWQEYMLQCNVEQSFKELKNDLGIRPVYHHKQERVDGHIFVAFLSYCLQITLRHRLRASACALTSQAVLETMSRIQMLDVSFETVDGRTLLMQRYTEPEKNHRLILSHLKMELPRQKPPGIYKNQTRQQHSFVDRPTALARSKIKFFTTKCESWDKGKKLAPEIIYILLWYGLAIIKEFL